ncbi:WD repeat-containing protein 36-like, partial [Saccostrea cucullata]|uniref:WD repeat-containing protein 36-like n=1 Tax=Saccostrea cuccullata TaxID=36930 RepID=UPI002ED430FD
MPTGSKIFSGYRALGFVSDHVPLATRYNKRLKENYVITSVGKSFHTYNCSRLGITNISDVHPDNITCIAVNNRYVFTGCVNVVRAFKRSRQLVHTFEGHSSEVHLLLPFGNHLISIDIHSNLKIWDVENGGVYLEMGFSNSTFHITALVHPSTYLNKIVLGSKQGTLQLWNILKDKMLYSFSGWGSPVTVLQQSYNRCGSNIFFISHNRPTTSVDLTFSLSLITVLQQSYNRYGSNIFFISHNSPTTGVDLTFSLSPITVLQQ